MGSFESVDYISMGKRVRKYRERINLTQSELARRISISNTTLSHIEVGSGRPELNTVVRLANALGVTVDMLLCESLGAADAAYRGDIAELTADCSTEELRLLGAVIPPILESIRRIRSTER